MSTNTTEGNLLNLPTLTALAPTFDTTNAGGHFSLNESGQITGTGGVGDFSQWLGVAALGAGTREQFTVSLTLVLTAQTSSSFGCGIGIRSLNPFPSPSLHFFVDCSAGPNSSAIYIGDDGSHTLVAPASGSLSLAAGQLIQLVVTRAFNAFTFTVNNLVTGQSRTISVSAAYPDSGLLGNTAPNFELPNTSWLSINNHGGDYTITSFAVDSPCLVNADLEFLGDSQTQGYSGGTLANRVANLVGSATGLSYRVEAGPGDTTTQLLATLATRTSHGDRTVVLIGVNDLNPDGANTPLSALEANIQSIDATLRARGSQVSWELPLPHTTAVDTSGLRAFLISAFAARYIDTSAGWDAGTMTSADGLHPTAAGNQHRAQIIATWLAAHPLETAVYPASGQVLAGIHYGPTGAEYTGTYTPPTVPASTDVRYGVGNGTLRVPTASQVLSGVLVDATAGNVVLPAVTDVRAGTTYGAGGNASAGTLQVTTSGSGLTPDQAAQLDAVATAIAGAGQILLASLYVPTAAPVLLLPQPPNDATLCTVYGYCETPQGTVAAGTQLTFTLKTPAEIRGNKLVSGRQVTVTTDNTGYFSVSLERNDMLTPAGSTWSVQSYALGIEPPKVFTVSTATLDLATIV